MTLVMRKPTELLNIVRASTGSYFDAAGVLRYALPNRLRRSYDPLTLAFKGLLVEESRTNYILSSSALDAATWTNTNTSVTVNAAMAPDGTLTADKVVSTISTSGTHSTQVTSAGAVAVTAGVPVTFSVFVKTAEMTFVCLSFDSSNNTTPWGVTPGAWFNIPAGTVDSIVGTVGSTSIVQLANGWSRVSLTATPVVSGSIRPRLVPADAVHFTYTAAIGDGLYLWGVQVEIGATATSYIPTSGSAVARAADSITMTVDRSVTRTNILAASNSFSAWTTGSGASVASGSIPGPSGISGTADNVVLPAAIGISLATSALAVNTYTFSVFVKASAGIVQLSLGGTAYSTQRTAAFNLAGNAVTSTTDEAAAQVAGNGWVRLSITATPNAAGVSTLSIINAGTSSLVLGCFGSQMEQAAQATAYIPTTGATVSKIDYFNWYDALQGTIAAKFVSSPGTCLLSIDDGTNGFTITQDANGAVVFAAMTNGVANFSITGAAVPSGQLLSVAACWMHGINSVEISLGVNGYVVTASPYVRFDFVSAVGLRLGSFAGNSQFINGYVRRVRYFKDVLAGQIANLSSES